MMGPRTLYSTKPHIKKATEGHLFIKATGSFLYTLHAYWKECSTDADELFFFPIGPISEQNFARCFIFFIYFWGMVWFDSMAEENVA